MSDEVMGPGKELDALVADKVMGLGKIEWVPCGRDPECGSLSPNYIDKQGWDEAIEAQRVLDEKDGVIHRSYSPSCIPMLNSPKHPCYVIDRGADYRPYEVVLPYSTDIGAAWGVYLKMLEINPAVMVGNRQVFIGQGQTINGRSAAHAICIAALKLAEK